MSKDTPRENHPLEMAFDYWHRFKILQSVETEGDNFLALKM